MAKPRAPRLAIVAGDFHRQLTDEMIAAATAAAQDLGATITHTIKVAGSYEVPLVVDALMRQKKVDAVIALGCIELGETRHGEVMGHVVHHALLALQLKYRKPIGIGIIGPGATPTQAQARKISAAQGAVQAVLRSLTTLREL